MLQFILWGQRSQNLPTMYTVQYIYEIVSLYLEFNKKYIYVLYK